MFFPWGQTYEQRKARYINPFGHSSARTLLLLLLRISRIVKPGFCMRQAKGDEPLKVLVIVSGFSRYRSRGHELEINGIVNTCAHFQPDLIGGYFMRAQAAETILTFVRHQ